MLWTILCLGASLAHACDDVLRAGPRSDHFQFIRVTTGERIDLAGVLDAYFETAPLTSFPRGRRRTIYAIVGLDDQASVRWTGLNAGVSTNAQLLSDLLLESTVFHAVRANHPGEVIALVRAAAPDGWDAISIQSQARSNLRWIR